MPTQVPSQMEDNLIYDWNKVGPLSFDPRRKVTLDDETLRDGLQNPSVIDPSIGEKIEILHLMEALGIEMVNIGLPGAGPRAMRIPKRWPRRSCGRE